MIYKVHFFASYEKAFFAPLICEKNTSFCLFLPSPPEYAQGGQKMFRGGAKKIARAFAPEIS